MTGLTALQLIEAALASGDPKYDPFEGFSQATGAGIANPYPHWLRMQGEGAVHQGTATPPGEVSMSDFMFGDRKVYSIFSHELADKIFKDAVTFSSRVLAETVGLVWGRTIIQMDDPEHGRYRRLIQQAFSKKEMHRWEHDIARPAVQRYIGAFVERGAVDVVRELLMIFPITVIAEAIGLPAGDLPRFFRLAVEMSGITYAPDRAFAASRSLALYLQEQIDARRMEPGPDLLTQLLDVQLLPEDQDQGGPKHLTDEEIVSLLRLLLIAGAETTARSSANLITLLLRHADQFEAVRRDRSLIPAAVEEALRFEPPLLSSTKLVTADVELDGVAIKDGEAVQVVIGAVNRDAGRWERPNQFDITRRPFPHLAFISGQHMCLGAHLARMEMRVVLEELLDSLPNLRFDPSAPEVEIRGRDLRAPASLPVVFDVRPAWR